MLFIGHFADGTMTDKNKASKEDIWKWSKDILKLFDDDRIRLIALGLILLVLAPLFVAKEYVSSVILGIIIIVVVFILNLEKVKRKQS